MKSKRQPTIAKIILFLLITASIVYATNVLSFSKPSKLHSYATMSTGKLQIEVEKHSLTGDLPFEMGLELMNRWSNDSL